MHLFGARRVRNTSRASPAPDLGLAQERAKRLDEQNSLRVFREEWVRGHLDHQRAEEAVKAAESRVEQAAGQGAIDDLNEARRHRAQVEAQLVRLFDRFCGCEGERSE